MKLLLDTSACVPLVEGNNAIVREAYRESLLAGDELFVSSISVFELAYGASKSKSSKASYGRLGDLLLRLITVLQFTEDDAIIAGQIRADLEHRKQPIGPFDTLIAGQALARNLTLITSNVREFSRVRDLRWQDWAIRT